MTWSPANPESVFTYGAPQLKFGTGAADEIGHDLLGLGATPVFGYLGHFRAPSSDAESIGDGGRR